MAEYLDYTLDNLLLFSPEIFFRQFALYNETLFPFHVVVIFLLVGLSICYKKSPTYFLSSATIILGVFYWLCGIAYHLNLYANINWAAHYFAKVFMFQGTLFFFAAYRNWCFVPEKRSKHSRILGVSLLFYATLMIPLIDLALRASWREIQFIGLTPDPTAMAGLALLVLFRVKGSAYLSILPCVWLVLNSLIYHTMGAYEGVVFGVIALIYVVHKIIQRAWEKPKTKAEGYSSTGA